MKNEKKGRKARTCGETRGETKLQRKREGETKKQRNKWQTHSTARRGKNAEKLLQWLQWSPLNALQTTTITKSAQVTRSTNRSNTYHLKMSLHGAQLFHIDCQRRVSIWKVPLPWLYTLIIVLQSPDKARHVRGAQVADCQLCFLGTTSKLGHWIAIEFRKFEAVVPGLEWRLKNWRCAWECAEKKKGKEKRKKEKKSENR